MLFAMKSIVQFAISQEDGIYIAEAINAPIVTQGETFEELQKNIQEATELFFEDEDPKELGFGPSPSILTSFEIPFAAHGSQA